MVSHINPVSTIPQGRFMAGQLLQAPQELKMIDRHRLEASTTVTMDPQLGDAIFRHQHTPTILDYFRFRSIDSRWPSNRSILWPIIWHPDILKQRVWRLWGICWGLTPAVVGKSWNICKKNTMIDRKRHGFWMFLDVSGEELPSNYSILLPSLHKRTGPEIADYDPQPRCWYPPSIWDFPCCQPVSRHISLIPSSGSICFGSHKKKCS